MITATDHRGKIMIHRTRGRLNSALLAGASAIAIVSAAPAAAQDATRSFDIPAQSLSSALLAYSRQSDTPVIASMDLLKGKTAPEVRGDLPQQLALTMLLEGSGLRAVQGASGGIVVERIAQAPQGGSAAAGGAEVEALIVTAQKREEDIQDVPIAISAFTQESLERSQIAGGPDLMTQIPNFTFTKTNFTSYSIQIRGIGTQAISATTDHAVAIAFNNSSMIRNRFFEQEFYDLQRIEVLRGPQGTLYGRNATAGVVNVISAKPKFNFEAKLSGDIANYNSTRLEGMINLPLVEDAVALRLAGAWTKRDGYSTNELTGQAIDGRDLWSTRVSLRVSPNSAFDANLIWEHFEEKDDRLRSGKQLCHTDDRTEIQGWGMMLVRGNRYSQLLTQGCLPGSMYAPEAFGVPDGRTLPYYLPLGSLDLPTQTATPDGQRFNPYASTTQSRDLRVIESTVDPEYRANSDIVQLQINLDVGGDLSLTSETTYSFDELFSLQDFNRFNTAPGAFVNPSTLTSERPGLLQEGPNGGIFCDPQIGCADRLVGLDLSQARSRQFSQELRLSSDYDGPFNFSVGANFLRYDTEDKYYVFINTLTMVSANAQEGASSTAPPWVPGVTDNHECMRLNDPVAEPSPFEIQSLAVCRTIDPNPIGSLNDEGHNYFLSRNPYKLISYAAFGEAYYNLAENLKLTAGLRYTVDKKEAPRIPSWLLAGRTIGHPVMEVEELEWREPTGRLAIDWKPDLSLTEETLLYASYAHGYKAGGSNPPVSGKITWPGVGQDIGNATVAQSLTKPKTFEAEYVDAFEIGAKNTLLDGRLTLNLGAFYYDYKNYQISQIVDRSAVNYNFDTEVWGLEIEADWRPLENLKLGFKGGYQNTRVADGEQAIDIMDRTAGREGWLVVRPFPAYTENCVLPLSVFTGNHSIADAGHLAPPPLQWGTGFAGPCEYAYKLNLDPYTRLEYVPNPTVRYDGISGLGSIVPIGYPGYAGFNPLDESQGHNHGEGFSKDLSGNELPNAPNFTATVTADYTVPLARDWLMTLHTDLYYQSEAWTRIFNTEGYDKLKAYTNVNLAAIFTNEDAGWKVMAYVKNVMDRDSITGAFLYPDDVGLTTNVFLTEPRLYGIRVTKDFTGGGWWSGLGSGPAPFTLELGGSMSHHDRAYDPLVPDSFASVDDLISPAVIQNKDLDIGEGMEAKLTYAWLDTPWRVSLGARSGWAKNFGKFNASVVGDSGCTYLCSGGGGMSSPHNWIRADATDHEEQLLVDFDIGRDVGLGAGIESSISAGLRYAEITSRTRLNMTGVPDWEVPDEWVRGFLWQPSSRTYYDTDVTAEREFKGFGPTLAWDSSKALFGDNRTGRVNADWSVSGGVLFGKQKTSVEGEEIASLYEGKYGERTPQPVSGPTAISVSDSRSKSATVPVLGAALGLSYEIQRVKISGGYRWERYFDVLDVGADEPKDADRTIDGPYLKISVGFGGG
ncbi:MAG TPA: TonB-dependent receptor [Caulobacteraceae bacterium]|nr:TonB-dependent receptor [Caulobacteraceae bacterium]